MARKGMLAGITDDKLTTVNKGDDAPVNVRAPAAPGFTGRGAFGAVTKTIDELAANARAIEARLTAGETVVELDPETIDASFVADRLEQNDEEFRNLVAAMQSRGQDSPILVRPHPKAGGRYQVAFGHRRLRAAKELKLQVRAVVKSLSDRDLLLAQGQENSARANLSFIEQAVFAYRLEQGGYDREMIMSALSVDKTVVSRMISVASKIPTHVIQAIGPASSTGRHRWIALAASLEQTDESKVAQIIASKAFKAAKSDERFNILEVGLVAEEAGKQSKKPTKGAGQGREAARVWSGPDGKKIARFQANERAFNFSIDSHVAPGFGDYLLAQMDRLYADYSANRKED